ncbi:MAG: 50S ribosomal protein L11 methyltransferase [Nitrospirales bacterium]|nr:50S ribosomal protein L11 methyltransferase [Nitrospirales bacterium]
MGYYEIKIKVSAEAQEALFEGLTGIGCLGMVEEAGEIIAYFSDNLGIDSIRSGMESVKKNIRESGLDGEISYDFLFLAERDWNETWKKKFQPIDVGQNLTIIPPWMEKKEGRMNLIIDPGMAFGTGHHETTKACLSFIEKIAKGERKESCLDVGTGTGILAIGASMLGYGQILGVDIDPLAIDAANRNIGLNNLTNITIKEGTISVTEGVYDLITANLMSEILIRIAPELAARLNMGCHALLSGMITGQEPEVIKEMEACGLHLLESFTDGRWVTLIMEKG